MQIGETIAMIVAMQDEGKCVICGQQHDEPKKEEIKETAPGDSGWKRKTMTGIFEKIPKKTAVYPGSKFPPSYTYQGHHCVALSAMVKNANTSSPTDKRIRLNHFLKKIGFFPNRDKNCIGLPARKGNGAYSEFWDSIDQGAPLQMHGPGHDEDYFDEVDALIRRLVTLITNPDDCKEIEKSEWEDKLKQGIESLENYAFNKLSKNESKWCLHREEQRRAIQIYQGATDRSFEVPGPGKSVLSYKGKGHTSTTITFPNPGLDEGPFRGT